MGNLIDKFLAWCQWGRGSLCTKMLPLNPTWLFNGAHRMIYQLHSGSLACETHEPIQSQMTCYLSVDMETTHIYPLPPLLTPPHTNNIHIPTPTTPTHPSPTTPKLRTHVKIFLLTVDTFRIFLAFSVMTGFVVGKLGLAHWIWVACLFCGIKNDINSHATLKSYNCESNK